MQNAMNKILLNLFFLLVLTGLGCTNKDSSVANDAKEVLQNTFNSDENFVKYKMTVLDVQVISESSTKYQGIANVEFEGKRYNVPLDVLTKSGKIFVQTKPGALAFLSEKDMEEAIDEFEKNMDSASKEFENRIEEVSRTVKD